MTDICWASRSCPPPTDSPKPWAWVCTEDRHGWVRAGTLDFGCGLAVPTALDPLCVPALHVEPRTLYQPLAVISSSTHTLSTTVYSSPPCH